ncbi:uncharacterized protein LOC114305283, partial [Camellia sinensis]|uniref:uncharacterized protein LOC114305283 n=1 Tax=Camellia sinensis TaxID=4442 RepID=UPI001035D887
MYQRLVGRLIYLTNTRPDLTFVVSVVSQFMHASRTENLDAVHHILRYLKTSPGLGLFFTDRRSTSGFCTTSGFYTFYGDHLISWKSKTQAVVSRSFAEAEYRAMAQGTSEALAEQVTKENVDKGLIYPPFSNIRKISAYITANVAAKAYGL